MSEQKNIHRLNVNLSEQVTIVLQEIAKSKGMTQSEIVRRAIEYYAKLSEYSEQGYKVGAWRQQEAGVSEFVEIIM